MVVLYVDSVKEVRGGCYCPEVDIDDVALILDASGEWVIY